MTATPLVAAGPLGAQQVLPRLCWRVRRRPCDGRPDRALAQAGDIDTLTFRSMDALFTTRTVPRAVAV